MLAPICFHHFRFHGHILGSELGFKEERGATHPGHTCVCHTQNPNLQLDHLTFGGMDCVFIPKSKMPLIFLMCFFNTFAIIVCHYFLIFCWHSHLFNIFHFFVVLGVVQVCFCSQPKLRSFLNQNFAPI